MRRAGRGEPRKIVGDRCWTETIVEDKNAVGQVAALSHQLFRGNSPSSTCTFMQGRLSGHSSPRISSILLTSSQRITSNFIEDTCERLGQLFLYQYCLCKVQKFFFSTITLVRLPVMLLNLFLGSFQALLTICKCKIRLLLQAEQESWL